jgi:hypothetical protein
VVPEVLGTQESTKKLQNLKVPQFQAGLVSFGILEY